MAPLSYSSDDTPIVSLKWSAKLAVVDPESRSLKLHGDKILLPPTALEQLIAAAPVVSSDPSSSQYTTAFDPFNPYTFAAERQARTLYQDRQPQLPHPLTFRLVNPENNRVIYAGIREFSAEEGTVGLSSFLRERLGYPENTLRDEDSQMSNGLEELSVDESRGRSLTITAQQLVKGTYVKLRPLEAGYDPQDWKALLEQHLRSNFTTLTNGDELVVPVASNRGKKEEFRFLIDGFRPEGDAICVVDTDLEVDIEALDEAQARETLKRIAAKSFKAPGTLQGSSSGGNLPFTQPVSGQVLDGEYVDYELSSWARSQGLRIELTADDDEDLDILINPFSTRQRSRPREDEYAFADFSSNYPKTVDIRPTNIELEAAESLWISVRAFAAETPDSTPSSQPRQYTIRATPFDLESDPHPINGDGKEEVTMNPEDVQCKNCKKVVSKGSLFLHENFCLRNNILCPQGCGTVFQKRSPEYQNHWHCPHDSSHGTTPSSLTKHNSLYHEPTTCPSCSTSFSTLPELAHHRITTCPGKIILCQFCHLEVPQEGDPTLPPDPSVLLSNLTPHEIADGARTTECHLCTKIVRLRDMSTHLRHHDLERASRPPPRLCRNILCGRTQDGVNKMGDTRAGTRGGQGPGNEIGLCSICYGPLYVSMYDPEGKAMRRRVERRYLSQLLTGCGKPWCSNSQFCRTGKKNQTGEDQAVGMKEGVGIVAPYLVGLKGREAESPLHFCVDEASQRRKVTAELMTAERELDGGYAMEWCVAGLEAEGGNLDAARGWLRNWAPKRGESGSSMIDS